MSGRALDWTERLLALCRSCVSVCRLSLFHALSLLSLCLLMHSLAAACWRASIMRRCCLLTSVSHCYAFARSQSAPAAHSARCPSLPRFTAPSRLSAISVRIHEHSRISRSHGQGGDHARNATTAAVHGMAHSRTDQSLACASVNAVARTHSDGRSEW